MKKARRSKLLAILLVLCLLTGMLCACGKDGSKKAGPAGPEGGGVSEEAGGTSEGGGVSKGTGAYVQKPVELPPELADSSITQVYTAENTLHLLVMKSSDEKVRLEEWAYQDGTFTNVTQDWLGAMELPGADWLEVKLVQSREGTQYLYAGYVAEGEDSFRGHLWKGTAGEAVDITPEKWSVPNEAWGGYEMIQGLAALDNGTLAVLSFTSVDILSAQDGSVLESESPAVIYEGNVVTDGENVYLCSSDGVESHIEKRKEGKGEGALTIPFPAGGSDGGAIVVGGSGSLFLDALRDGTLIAAGEDGIFRLPPDAPEGQWEQLAAGIETDFSMPDFWCLSLAAAEDGGIYALFQTGEGQRLNLYEYDPNAVAKAAQVLKLYTVYESSLLKQAAALYHKAHPEVVIDIESEYPLYSYDTPDYDTVYKKLNTMLMGDDAPDMLVLDHLNMESYAQRGLLEDLDDVVRPLEESGELLSNITGAYVTEDGKRYMVPLQFAFTLALGRDIAPENMNSLEAMADFLSQTDHSYLGSQTVEELVDLFYPYFCDRIVRDKQLDMENLSKYLGYLKVIADNSGMIDRRPEDEVSFGMWDLASKVKLALTDAKGFVNCMYPMSMADYIKGDYTAFENSFIPSIQLGICTKSRYPDTAGDFLEFALSRQVQDSEYSGGFPVNSLSLKKQSEKDRSDMSATTMIVADDGSYVKFDSEPYSKETAKRLTDICGTLDRPVREDAKIREVLIESLEGYLKGTESLDEAIQRIEAGLKMYLAE